MERTVSVILVSPLDDGNATESPREPFRVPATW
jgi:hypothetical protein